MDFLNDIKNRAKQDMKTIVLPEGGDARILEAARRIIEEKIANIIILGKPDKIDVPGAKVISLETNADQMAEELHELRKHKGMGFEKAKESLKNPLYYGSMLVKMGVVDGMAAGAAYSTSLVLRPVLQIVQTAPDSKFVSGFFIMIVDDKPYLFADCAINPNPTAEQLAEIAVCSGRMYEKLIGEKARVALLSYSTYGSAKGELVDKVRIATQLAQEAKPEMAIDGELQLDAAIVPEIAMRKGPKSPLGGNANVLVFPDLQAGNIGYKLVERMAKAKAFGPIMQGLSAPVNDLSRGCSVEDIVGVVAITCVQAQMNSK